MPRYRAKPVEVEAVQWRGHNYTEIKAFAGDDVTAPAGDTNKSWDLIVHTMNGATRAPINFYIVKDDAGTFYPCDPGVFERKYEPLP